MALADTASIQDHALVVRAQNGDSRAFDALVQRYQKKITQLVYRYVRDVDLALDIAQDVFLKAFCALPKYQQQAAFSTWLYRIAVNDCIDHIRRKKVRLESSLDELEAMGVSPALEEGHDVQQAMIDASERRFVRKALSELKPEQMQVLVLKVYQDMTFEEIAGVLEIPVSTIKSRLYKALDQLGRRMRQRSLLEGGS